MKQSHKHKLKRRNDAVYEIRGKRNDTKLIWNCCRWLSNASSHWHAHTHTHNASSKIGKALICHVLNKYRTIHCQFWAFVYNAFSSCCSCLVASRSNRQNTKRKSAWNGCISARIAIANASRLWKTNTFSPDSIDFVYGQRQPSNGWQWQQIVSVRDAFRLCCQCVCRRWMRCITFHIAIQTILHKWDVHFDLRWGQCNITTHFVSLNHSHRLTPWMLLRDVHSSAHAIVSFLSFLFLPMLLWLWLYDKQWVVWSSEIETNAHVSV